MGLNIHLNELKSRKIQKLIFVCLKATRNKVFLKRIVVDY